MQPQDFRTHRVQAALWWSRYQPTSRQIMDLALRRWSALLDAEPTLLPRLVGLPSGTPHFIVGSSDQHWRLQITEERADLFWQQQGPDDAIEPARLIAAAVDTLLPLTELDNRLRVVRLAFIVTRVMPQENPGRTLAEFFCRTQLLQGPLNRPEGFELHAHKAYDPARGPRVNSWIRWKTAARQEEDRARDVIVVEQDLNTPLPAPDQPSFDADQVRSFFDVMQSEADAILSLYLSIDARGAA